jgi:(2Fe-2S) ferredoxin
MDDAKREGEIFMKMRPDYVRNIVEEHKNRNVRPRDNARMIASLRKAGLPVPDEAEVEAEISVSNASHGL